MLDVYNGSAYGVKECCNDDDDGGGGGGGGGGKDDEGFTTPTSRDGRVHFVVVISLEGQNLEVVRFRFLRIAIPVPWAILEESEPEWESKESKRNPFPIPNSSFRQKDFRYTIPKFEEPCHL